MSVSDAATGRIEAESTNRQRPAPAKPYEIGRAAETLMPNLVSYYSRRTKSLPTPSL